MLTGTFLVDQTAITACKHAIYASPGERTPSSAHRGARGFTLIEALIATILIGLGAVAVMMSAGSGTKVNQASLDMTQASFLAQELREWTLQLPIDDPNSTNDLKAMDSNSFTTPLDGRGSQITGMPHWKEKITVTWRNPSDLDSAVADGASDIVYVEVTIKRHDYEILTTGWLIAKS